MLTGENDPRSAQAVKTMFLKDQCTKLLIGNKLLYPTFPTESKADEETKILIPDSRGNKTLAFIAIDSLQYFHFAEGLGIDLLKMRDKTAVVILDSNVSFIHNKRTKISHKKLKALKINKFEKQN